MSIANENNVVRSITFIPVANPGHIKQMVKVTASKGAPNTWVSMRVRSENPGILDGNDSTKLTDGRALSDLDGKLTLRALPEGEKSPLKENDERPESCGVICYDRSSRYNSPDYAVTLYLSIRELHQVAELTRMQGLAAIHVEFRARLEESKDESIPGLHPSQFGRLAFYVWEPNDAIAIDNASVEFELDRAAGAASFQATGPSHGSRLRLLTNRAHRTLARVVVEYPQLKWAGDGVSVNYLRDKQAELSPEQIRSIAQTGAGNMVEYLIQDTFKQGGHIAYNAASCAVEFIRANGIIYRTRAKQAEDSARKKAAKPTTPSAVPGYLGMWVAPSIRADQEMDGWNSLEALDRSSLVDVCTQFYRSGARCNWFEKMLVESLVGAETYATLKASKTEPSRWSGQVQFLRTLVASWAFGKSKGGAMYQVYMLVGNAAITVGKFAVFAAFCWWAYSKYELNANWQSVVGLAVLALVALGWLGRHITQHIVRWSRPIPAQAATATLLSTPFGSALSALFEAYAAVSGDATSITAARDAVRAAISKGGAIDHIALAFLDRAHEGKEIVWMRSGGSGYATELDPIETATKDDSKS